MASVMKAVGFQLNRPATEADALVDLQLPVPQPGARDLIVRVAASALNPIDTKLRMRVVTEPGQPKVLGYDAAGTVVAVGSDVTLFKVGDAVFYAGSMQRQGANAELQAVDERLVGRLPTTLAATAAAVLPLTAITAWEMLFDKFRLPRDSQKTGVLLVMGGAGGVGSILIQLARQLTGLTIVATASRPESRQWCLDMGAHHVINHSAPLPEQFAALGLAGADYIACLTETDQHIDAVVALANPFGELCVIDDLTHIDFAAAKRKCLTLHWEFMFARSNFQTADMGQQGKILGEVADLIDRGLLRSTVAEVVEGLSADTLRQAHLRQESGRSVGKLAIRH